MKIAFITEKYVEGYVKDDETNTRVDVLWAKMLNAYHYNINNLDNKKLGIYDAILVIYPKGKPILLNKIKELTEKYNNVILIQEGPATYVFDNWPLEYQNLFVDVCNSVAGVLCHNACDLFFFKGLTNKPVNMLHTVIDFEEISKLRKQNKQEIVFVGAGAGGWYNGTSSFMSVKDLGKDVVFAKMGRNIGEEAEHWSKLSGLKVTELPYMDYTEFMKITSNYKYAIHLMPTVAAGTTSLGFAALGTPVVGNYLVDTQRECFPQLSVQPFQIQTAKELMKKLIEDKNFYDECSIYAMQAAKWFDYKNQKEITINRIKGILEGKGFDELIEKNENLQDNNGESSEKSESRRESE